MYVGFRKVTRAGGWSSHPIYPSIAAGRKGWQFFLNEGGGESAAILFNLISTAKAAGINPADYLRDVLVRIDFEQDWEKLLPGAWKEHFAPEVTQRREAAMRELSFVR